MLLDSWLPISYELPRGLKLKGIIHGGDGWQIFKSSNKAQVLIAKCSLAEKWIGLGLIDKETIHEFNFGAESYYFLVSESNYALTPIPESKSPINKGQALAFAEAFKNSRTIDKSSSFHDGIYFEKISRILPTLSLSEPKADELVLGTWLSGGLSISTTTARRLSAAVSWLGKSDLKEILDASGLDSNEYEGNSLVTRSVEKKKIN